MEVTLETERLLLRAFRGSDHDAYAVMCADPEVMQYLTGEPLGRVGFLDPPGWPGFELGWVLGRQHWGHGYAVEAAAAARDYAFDEIGKDRLISLIRPANARSIRVAEKLGERLTGEVDLLGSPSLVYELRRA